MIHSPVSHQGYQETSDAVRVLAIAQTAQPPMEHCVQLERLMEGWGERCKGEETAAAFP